MPYVDEILILMSCAVRADQIFVEKEVKMVEQGIIKYFGQRDVGYVKSRLAYFLKKNWKVEKVCKKMNGYLSQAERIGLLDTLVRITVADQFLASAEQSFLERVSSEFRLGSRVLNKLLAMHSFTREKERTRNSRSTTRSFSGLTLKKAFAILDLAPESSTIKIKKAYRKLVKRYHPDRVIHMGPEFKESAKEKFQAIQEAYDFIKAKKNIA